MSIYWFSSISEFKRLTSSLAPLVEPLEQSLRYDTPFVGYCTICDSFQQFTISSPTNDWINLRNRVNCKSCGFSARHRAVFASMRASPSWRTGKALVFERVTPFFTLLSNRLPNAVGCEYLSEFADPGTELLFKGVRVRHEDMLRLSFPDETFDAIYHGDVLEHVPDMTKALQECYRALKQEGELLFTLPFYSERESTITRAKIVDGTRIDIHPPAYHGNPLSAEGALVYSEPGLEFFNQVSSIGDWATEIGLAYSIADGYFSDAHRNPKSRCFNVVFRCRKGKRH